VSRKRLRLSQGGLTAGQKSAGGNVVTAVAKARTAIGVVGLQPNEWSCTSQSTSVELAGFGSGEARKGPGER